MYAAIRDLVWWDHSGGWRVDLSDTSAGERGAPLSNSGLWVEATPDGLVAAKGLTLCPKRQSWLDGVALATTVSA